MGLPETGLTRSLYQTLFKRNTVFVGVIFAAAFVFEVAFDKVTDQVWEQNNKGKLWKDIKARMQDQQE